MPRSDKHHALSAAIDLMLSLELVPFSFVIYNEFKITHGI